MKTITLFGGSFDPPHIGHEAIVKSLQLDNDIDEIIVMPTFLNPFKSLSHAPSTLRLKWLRDIFLDYKNVKVSSYEVDAKKKVPTIVSVKHLLESYSKVYLVVGADNLKGLSSWTSYEELKDLVTFIVAPRDKIKIDTKFKTLNVDVNISSTNLRENMDTKMLNKKCEKEIQNFYKEKNER